jgi:hypothetical protein
LEFQLKQHNKRPGSNVKSQHSHKCWNFPGKLDNEARVLHSILPEIHTEKFQHMVDSVKSLITSLIRNHGYTDGLKRYGIIKNYTIQLIEGRNPDNPGWISTSEKFRVPSKLGKEFAELLVHYLEQQDRTVIRDDRYYQVILTLLNIIRKVKGLSDPDYKSITEKAKPINENLLKDFETYVSEILTPHVYNPDDVHLDRYPISIKKKGPNGVPKMESAHEEAIKLTTGNLWKPFKNICSYLESDYLVDYLTELSGVIPDAPVKDIETRLRVIVPVPDSGGKTRLVAIADFWTQLVLEPIRHHVQEVIERLFGTTDFRLNQDDGFAAMVELQQSCIEGKVYNGHQMDINNLGFIDASSWTDRFHRDLQKITMRHLFSPYLAEAWAQLVVHCDWYAPKTKRIIKYGQGQGMGTNGSFDIATLTDHLFLKFIRSRNPVMQSIHSEHIRLYGKVGDDLFTYDYKTVLDYYEQINLPINLSKSKV